MNKLIRFSFIWLMLMNISVEADTSAVFDITVDKPMAQVYPQMTATIDESPFYIFLELNIGKNLANFSEKWGDEYNQSGLSAIRSIVLCNGWYANQVSNKDPKMLGLCPLHITMIEKDGKTTALFNRPTAISKGSPAHDIIVEIEQKIIKLIQSGMQ